MEIEFDQLKSKRNERERGLPFSLATEFDWGSSVDIPSSRHGEERRKATGIIRNRIHVIVYVRRGENLRIISLRRANEREVKHYEETKPLPD